MENAVSHSFRQDDPETSESLRAFARLLARAAVREVLVAGSRGGRDSGSSRAPTASVVRPPCTPKLEQETGA